LSYGPFNSFKVLGIIFAVVITLLSLPLKFPKKLTVNTENLTEKSNEINLSSKNMIKTRGFYALWLTYTIGTLVGLMAIGISSPVAEELINLDATTASIYVSLFAIFNGIGRPIFGGLTDKLKPRKTALISFSLIIAASLLMLFNQAGNPVIYFISFALFWLNLGGWLAIAPAATAIFFGSKNYSKNYGILFTAYGVGAVIGNLFSGSIRDIFGSYMYVFYPTIILAVIGIIISLISLKESKIKTEAQEKIA